MAEPCDSIGSPASHQQLVVVQAIVHTDDDPGPTGNRIVKIPPYVPLFLTIKDGSVMQTDGIAHVSLAGYTNNFFGISTDFFVAHHSRGEATNHISVAISGLVTIATPNVYVQNAYFGSAAAVLGNVQDAPRLGMMYEGTTCTPVRCADLRPIAANFHIGRYIRHIDQSYDGIAVILKGKPHSVSISATAGELDDGPAEPAPVRPAPVRPAPVRPAPVRAASTAVETTYAMSDSDDEPAVGGKRKSPAPAPADGAASVGAAKRKKKGSRKKTAAVPSAEADGTV